MLVLQRNTTYLFQYAIIGNGQGATTYINAAGRTLVLPKSMGESGKADTG